MNETVNNKQSKILLILQLFEPLKLFNSINQPAKTTTLPTTRIRIQKTKLSQLTIFMIILIILSGLVALVIVIVLFKKIQKYLKLNEHQQRHEQQHDQSHLELLHKQKLNSPNCVAITHDTDDSQNKLL